MNSLNSHWIPGEKVSGVYCGQEFTGKLNAYTRPTYDYRNTIFSIALDNEITVYGMKRTSIEIESNSKTNTVMARGE